MIFSLFRADPLLALAWLIALFFSLTFHEFSHAFIAKLRGDRTAEFMGRLTLNPFAHIDPLGLMFLLFVGFGWAKPVPYNPRSLRDPRWDSARIALAGPASNFLLAMISALILRGLLASGALASDSLLLAFLFLVIILNLSLMFFNLIPIPPLDGSKFLFAFLDGPEHVQTRFFLERYGSLFLLGFAVILPQATGIDIFGFISSASSSTCSWLLGVSCGF
ncbi:site-2 protease family protein [Candidatus Uhrbacteria bacterium]|nr:site-2 protease family protein [Candidatus Uhrbacteria bacterium]